MGVDEELVEVLLRNASGLGGPNRGNVSRLTHNLVIKRCDATRTAVEVEALAFVATHTSLPVPRVHLYWESADCGNIVMDYIEGETLQRVWRQLSDAQRHSVMQKIATYVDQLRAIPQPPPTPGANLPLSGWIGSPLGHAFRDFAMTQASFSFGPFASQRAFYDWRVSRFREIGNRHQPTAARIAQISQTMPCTHPIVFTHGDINRRNVLVRVHGNSPDDIEVTAIVDWEQAGWRPIYWESFKWLFEDGSTPDWAEFGTTQIGAQYEAAVALDFELQSISGHIPS